MYVSYIYRWIQLYIFWMKIQKIYSLIKRKGMLYQAKELSGLRQNKSYLSLNIKPIISYKCPHGEKILALTLLLWTTQEEECLLFNTIHFKVHQNGGSDRKIGDSNKQRVQLMWQWHITLLCQCDIYKIDMLLMLWDNNLNFLNRLTINSVW